MTSLCAVDWLGALSLSSSSSFPSHSHSNHFRFFILLQPSKPRTNSSLPSPHTPLSILLRSLQVPIDSGTRLYCDPLQATSNLPLKSWELKILHSLHLFREQAHLIDYYLQEELVVHHPIEVLPVVEMEWMAVLVLMKQIVQVVITTIQIILASAEAMLRLVNRPSSRRELVFSKAHHRTVWTVLNPSFAVLLILYEPLYNRIISLVDQTEATNPQDLLQFLVFPIIFIWDLIQLLSVEGRSLVLIRWILVRLLGRRSEIMQRENLMTFCSITLMLSELGDFQ